MKPDFSVPPPPKQSASSVAHPNPAARSSTRDLFLKAQSQSGQTVTTISTARVREKANSLIVDTEITGPQKDQQEALEFINARRAESGVAPMTSVADISNGGSQVPVTTTKATRKARARKQDLGPMNIDVPAPSVAPEVILPELKIEFVLSMGTFQSKVSAIEVSNGGQSISVWYPTGMDSLFRPAAGVELTILCLGASYAVISSGVHIESEAFDCGVSIFFNKPTQDHE